MNYSLIKRKRKLKGQIRMDNTEAQRVYAHKTQNGRKKAKKKKTLKNKLTHKTLPKKPGKFKVVTLALSKTGGIHQAPKKDLKTNNGLQNTTQTTKD
jgi:hypothetical protein